MEKQIVEMKLDLEELKTLNEKSERLRSKTLLGNEINKLEEEIKRKVELSEKKTDAKPKLSQISTIKIINYAWDQSDKFVKLYVTLNGVQSLPADSISTVYTQKSIELIVTGVENKCHSLKITNLAFEIKPSDSHHKVKQDMVVLFLRKDKPKHWSCVTELELKAKEMKSAATKPKEDEDPSKGVMSLMKQMYDDGDDDMKRTIAKAWTEARDKEHQ